jgi:hypothetical protein
MERSADGALAERFYTKVAKAAKETEFNAEGAEELFLRVRAEDLPTKHANHTKIRRIAQ